MIQHIYNYFFVNDITKYAILYFIISFLLMLKKITKIKIHFFLGNNINILSLYRII